MGGEFWMTLSGDFCMTADRASGSESTPPHWSAGRSEWHEMPQPSALALWPEGVDTSARSEYQ